MSRTGYVTSSGNVFKDLRVPHAEEHLVKAQLVFKIDTLMKQRRLTQVAAAALFGVRQPDVSKMLRGEFRQFSVERLLRFLVALDQDVEIVITPHRGRRKPPRSTCRKRPARITIACRASTGSPASPVSIPVLLDQRRRRRRPPWSRVEALRRRSGTRFALFPRVAATESLGARGSPDPRPRSP